MRYVPFRLPAAGTKSILPALLLVLLLSSCAGTPAVLPPERMPPERPVPEKIPSAAIASPGTRTEARLAAYLRKGNPAIGPGKAAEIAKLYTEEAAAEGINHDIAFCQMLLETGFLKFGGTVRPEQNNFCGLGVVDAKTPGEAFPTPRIGVRAHIQHLKAYATTEPLRQVLVDRRFRFVKRGTAPTYFALSGRWASDPAYGRKLHNLLVRLYEDV